MTPDPRDSDRVVADEPIDLILGQADDADGLRARLQDPLAALEMAETRSLVETFRELGADVLAGPRVRRNVAAASAARRQSLRRRLRPVAPPMPMFLSWSATAAAAVVLLGVLVGIQGGAAPGFAESAVDADPKVAMSGEALVPELIRHTPLRVHRTERGEVVFTEWASEEPDLPLELPVRRAEDPMFHAIMARWEDHEMPNAFTAWVAADNNLAILRQEFRNRFTPTARRRALRLTGGNPAVDTRVQSLAAVVAERVDAALMGRETEGAPQPVGAEPSVRDVALSLRALLAAGSDTRMGRHRATVRRCAAWMEARITARTPAGETALDDAELAIALAAMSDVSICSGRYGELVGEYSERLALRTIHPTQGARPGLLQWSASALVLGDAGRVFRLAPAFGVRTSVAYRARMLVAAHLEERLATDADDPVLLAAQRYGFDDLVDREAVDQKLRVWRASFLKPDYVAMHHLAWSQYPVRPGWARFQQELRGLAAMPTPPGVGDPAALLLCLAMNFAAPGVSELLGAEG